MKESDITLGTILEHMRGMESRIMAELHETDGRLTKRIDSLEANLVRIHRNLSGQIDQLDKRLDAIEIEELPKRVTRIERHLGLTSAAA